MSTSSEEVYRELINLRQTIHDNHMQLRDDLDGIKTDLVEKIEKVEIRVNEHDQTFKLGGKILACVGFPSGAGVIGLICWFISVFHK